VEFLRDVAAFAFHKWALFVQPAKYCKPFVLSFRISLAMFHDVYYVKLQMRINACPSGLNPSGERKLNWSMKES
jgi:hypothetical protein